MRTALRLKARGERTALATRISYTLFTRLQYSVQKHQVRSSSFFDIGRMECCNSSIQFLIIVILSDYQRSTREKC